MKRSTSSWTKYFPKATGSMRSVIYGYSVAQTLVQVLKQAATT